MTHDPNQVIVGDAPEIRAWLKDRFGIDADKTYVARDGVNICLGKKDEVVTMTVVFFVGGDDLRAFPDRTKLPKAAA